MSRTEFSKEMRDKWVVNTVRWVVYSSYSGESPGSTRSILIVPQGSQPRVNDHPHSCSTSSQSRFCAPFSTGLHTSSNTFWTLMIFS